MATASGGYVPNVEGRRDWTEPQLGCYIPGPVPSPLTENNRRVLAAIAARLDTTPEEV